MAKTREPRPVPTTSRKARASTSAPMVARDPKRPEPTAEELARMIAERAYLLAEQRGFAAGGEVEDWLAAERAVTAELARA